MLSRPALLAIALLLSVLSAHGQAVRDGARQLSPLEWWLDDVAQATRVRQLVSRGRLQELSDGTLAALRARQPGDSIEGVVHRDVWPALTQALAEGRVDDEAWHALLLEQELSLRQAGSEQRLDRHQLDDWFFLVELLGAWERLAPPLLQARAQGATLDLVGHREALLLHARPEQAGALVTRFTSVVHGVLLDTEHGPDRPFDSWAPAGQQRFVVMDRYLDVVAAAYHAALVSGQRDQAGWVLRDARAAVRAREVARLPDLERRLAGVDQALRAAGIEPLPPPVPPTDAAPPDDQPTDGQPTDGQPTDGQPTDGQPTDGQPTGDGR